MDDDYGKMAMNCLEMARSDFYATHAHNYTTNLTLIARDSQGTVVGAAAAALDLIKNVQVQAIIGPTFSTQASFLISLGDKARVPIITFSASSPSLSSIPTQYFIRATLNDASQVKAIGAIVKEFGWRQVVLIYEDSSFGEGIIPYLTDALEDVNAGVPYRSVISQNASDDQIAAELYKLMSMQTRVFVVHMLNPLTSRLFTKVKQLGMMNPEYAWIISASIAYELNLMDRTVIESMLGVIGVRPRIQNTKELHDFQIQFKKESDNFDLWAFDSVTALAMAVEQAKLTNPLYIKANNSGKSTNLEAFGESNAGPKLIEALRSTTFNGLAGHFNVGNGQLQAPPFEIINMVGPGARVLGYWTEDKGISRELNFNSSNTNTNFTSQSKLGIIIWPGDRAYPPKGWVIPTNGKILRVGVPVKRGFKNFVRVTWNLDNSTKVEGYCIDVFDAVMKELPYGVRYEYFPFATPPPDRKMKGSYDDLTNGVATGIYDAVVGDVTIRAKRSINVDFTLPYIQSAVSMVVPFKDDERITAWVFLRPLTWELWLTSFCSFIVVGFLIWILEHRINEDFRGPFWHQVGMIFWFSFSTMVFAHKEKVISNLARFLLIIWFLVVLILTSSYTASLASMLTVQKLIPSVDDVDDLIRRNQTVGFRNGSFVLELLKQKFTISHLKPFETAEDMYNLLSNRNIAAAFHEDPYLKLFLSKYGSKYTMVGPIYKAEGFGFVFPKGSPLVPDVSRAILHVTEGTKLGEIERKWLNGPSNHTDYNTLSSNQRNLELASFWGLFLIVGIAGTVALVIYVIMFLQKNWKVIQKSSTTRRKITELLRIFNEEDCDSPSCKKTVMKEKASTYGCDSPCPNCQIASTPTSRYDTYPPCPDFLNQMLHQDKMRSPDQITSVQHGESSQSSSDYAETNQQDELSQTRHQGIELSNLTEKRKEKHINGMEGRLSEIGRLVLTTNKG